MSVFELLIVATVQCSALLLVALLIDRLSHNQSAALRHGMLTSIMTLVVLCPICTVCLPPLRVLPIEPQGLATSSPVDDTARIQDSVKASNHVMDLHSSMGIAQGRPAPLADGVSRKDHRKPDDKENTGQSTASEVASFGNNWRIAPIESWVWWIWVLGSSMLLLRILLSWISLHYICLCGEPDKELEALGDRSDVKFLKSDIVTTPLSFGLVAPCVVVPRPLAAKDFDKEKLEGILLHELAHIDRRDSIWQWVTLLCQCFHWFNPLVWIASYKIELLREVACDDLVVASGISPQNYAQSLVEALPKSSMATERCLALSLSSASDMETRIRSILNEAKNRGRSNGRLLVLAAITAGVAIVSVSILRAREPQTSPQVDSIPRAESASSSDAPEADALGAEEERQGRRVVPTLYRNADFAKAKIDRAAGREAFIQADFSRARLTNAILSGGNYGFQRASFERADAAGTLLLGGKRAFQHATFKNARLSGTVFSAGPAAFRQAVFDGADLERAVFHCSPTALIDISVSGTNFDMADLRQIKPIVLRSWKFDVNRPPLYSSLTRFPEGFSPSANGWQKPENSVRDDPKNALLIRVLDNKDQPVSGARIFQNHVYLPDGAPDDRKNDQLKNHYYTTNENGQVSLSWPGDSVDLRIWVSHPGFVPVHAMWAESFQPDDHEIPKEFSIRLSPGTTIGGVVRDETGKPVAGAFVEIKSFSAMKYNILGAEENRKRPVPSSWLAEGAEAIITDREGRWRAFNVPEGDVELEIRVSHAQFATNEGTGALRNSLRELRAETAVTALDPRGGIK